MSVDRQGRISKLARFPTSRRNRTSTQCLVVSSPNAICRRAEARAELEEFLRTGKDSCACLDIGPMYSSVCHGMENQRYVSLRLVSHKWRRESKKALHQPSHHINWSTFRLAHRSMIVHHKLCWLRLEVHWWFSNDPCTLCSGDKPGSGGGGRPTLRDVEESVEA